MIGAPRDGTPVIARCSGADYPVYLSVGEMGDHWQLFDRLLGETATFAPRGLEGWRPFDGEIAGGQPW